MVVPANSPIKNAKDLAEAVKKDVAKVTFAGGSAGGVDHIMAALFVGAAGGDASKVNYVPFSGGGELLAAILGGKVTAGISGFGEYEGQIKAGKLRAIGVTSPQPPARHRRTRPSRSRASISCSPTGARCSARPASPTRRRRRSRDLVDKMVKSNAWKEVLKQKGWDDAYLPGDAFAKFLADEQKRVEGVHEDGRLGEVTHGTCPGRSAARSGAPLIRGRSKGIIRRSRVCSAPLRAALRPGTAGRYGRKPKRPDRAAIAIAVLLLLARSGHRLGRRAPADRADLRPRPEGDALRGRGRNGAARRRQSRARLARRFSRAREL